MADVLALMFNNNCSCVVVAENEVPVGIITERDIVRMFTSVRKVDSLLLVNISEVMTSSLVTVNGKDNLFEALVIAKVEGVRHLPVVDSDGKLIGIVTQSDLVNAHFRIYEQQREIIENSINERTEILVKANEELRALSLEDPLLGIGNRRSMEVDLQHTHASAIRYKYSYSVLILDIDYFKAYNDFYGHPAGDNVLKLVSNALKASLREADRLYRYGGEEFLALLPETDASGAKLTAERMIENVKGSNIKHCMSPYQIITISAGSCNFNDSATDKSWKDIIKKADTRLYKAKEGGRSRAVTEDSGF